MSISFGGQQIGPDKSFQEFIISCSHGTGIKNLTTSDVDQKPFRRNVDVWFFALCLAVRKGLKRQKVENSYNMIDGSILEGWQANAIALIAAKETGDFNVITDIRRILRIANELANAGMPEVKLIIEKPDMSPLWTISETCRELLKGNERA